MFENKTASQIKILWGLFAICAATVFSSIALEIVLKTRPCSLCKTQRVLWQITFFVSCLSFFMMSKNKTTARVGYYGMFWGLRFLLCLILFAGTTHFLVHRGLLSDFCVRNARDFQTTSEYILYLARHSSCSKNVFILAGVPTYAFSIFCASAALTISFFTHKPRRIQ